MDAERQFFALSCGKDAYEGTGQTITRLARKVSQKNTYREHIVTPRQLYK
jgi:hypothetical protein